MASMIIQPRQRFKGPAIVRGPDRDILDRSIIDWMAKSSYGHLPEPRYQELAKIAQLTDRRINVIGYGRTNWRPVWIMTIQHLRRVLVEDEKDWNRIKGPKEHWVEYAHAGSQITFLVASHPLNS